MSLWVDTFQDEIYSLVLSSFVKFSGAIPSLLPEQSSPLMNSHSKSHCISSVAASFRSALECCTPTHILTDKELDIEARLRAEDATSSLPVHIQSKLNQFTQSMVSPAIDVQMTAFHLMRQMMPYVAKGAETDMNAEINRREAMEDDMKPSAVEGHPPPSALAALFHSTQSAFDFLVEDMAVGETMRIDLDDPAHSYVLSYLLSWNLLRALLSEAGVELRVQYCLNLRIGIDKILRHLLYLLPDFLLKPQEHPASSFTVASVSHTPLGCLNIKSKEDVPFLLFNQDPALPRSRMNRVVNYSGKSISHYHAIGLNFYMGHTRVNSSNPLNGYDTSQPTLTSTIRSLNGLAGGTFFGTLRDLPASVRQWWTDTDKKRSEFVERIAVHHISPVLCMRELQSVSQDKIDQVTQLENITVKVRLNSREVVALYTMDEIVMELLIKLPANFPLGQIVVECPKKVGDCKDQRRWLLQLTTFLQFQNGSIVDGITMWKRNIDKPFEGVDPCMVCFSVLHGTNYQLPKHTCKACKKKFHSACLFKWFETSNNSSCPLCRSLF